MNVKHLIITVFILTISSCKNKNNTIIEETTSHYYLIRHAEKEQVNLDDPDPELTRKGKLRAENWSNFLVDVKFDAVFSTNYTRTLQTAKPTAIKNNLEITIHNPDQLDVKSFLKETAGKTVLIVGHTNTTPKLANKIINKKVYNDINDKTFNNLYHITIKNGKVINYKLLTIEL